MKLHIKGGRVIDPATRLDAPRDLLIAAGRIVGIAEPGAQDDFDANRTFDATGLVIIPGLVDLSARLREPGSEYRATLESEIDAALAGGVTSLVCPPDTDPVLDEPGLVEMLKHRARTLNRTHVHPLGALTVGLAGVALTEMSELHDAGCVGFSQANIPIADTQVLLRALQYAQTFGFTVWWRPQDPYLGRGGVAASGPVAARLGLPSVPASNETVALLTIFELLRSFGLEHGVSAAPRVHLCRLSSAGGIALVRAARAEGLPVSCDVGVHHVHMIDIDIGFFDAQCRVDPPFRGQRDRAAIRSALADGTIDAICSDHTPVDDDAKLLPFGDAEPGATGLELLLPLVLKWAAEERIPLIDALAHVTHRAAAVVAGPGGSIPTGRIEVGGVADLCLFDADARWTVSPGALKSQGKNTPFNGYEMQGRVRATVVGGTVVHEART
ncbi:MAG: dihydroorotase [Burkholderiaceae bacterium]